MRIKGRVAATKARVDMARSARSTTCFSVTAPSHAIVAVVGSAVVAEQSGLWALLQLLGGDRVLPFTAQQQQQQPQQQNAFSVPSKRRARASVCACVCVCVGKGWRAELEATTQQQFWFAWLLLLCVCLVVVCFVFACGLLCLLFAWTSEEG